MGLEQGESNVTIVPPVTNIAALYRQFLLNGASSNMIVDGSGTPVVFKVAAHATKDTTLFELRYVFGANSLFWGGTTFGAGGGALANGLLIETFISGIVTQLGNPTVNERFLQLPARNDVIVSQAGNRDLIAMSIDLAGGIVLAPASADEVRVTVRDDLTAAVRQINYLQFAVFGSQEI